MCIFTCNGFVGNCNMNGMNKLYWLKWIISFAFIFSITTELKSQDEKLKAIFVYNFTRYIDWPQKPGNFVIVVLGRSPIYTEIEDIASKKKVGSVAIEVKSANSPEEITDGHIIYISSSKTNSLPLIVAKSQEMHMLVITEKEGACKNGSGINFVNKDGKLSFEIAKTNLASCGLVVSSSLLGLGTVIKE